VRVPVYVPAARVEALAFTVTVAGALALEDVACSHGESDVTVNGTAFPIPTAVTCRDCPAGVGDEPVIPVKVRLSLDSCKTGFVVTTSVTGSEVTGCPDMLIMAVVV
jgi:hypothetical protein